jgi:hypothetical protein
MAQSIPMRARQNGATDRFASQSKASKVFNAWPSLDLYMGFGRCAGSGKTAVGGDQVQVGMADKG